MKKKQLVTDRRLWLTAGEDRVVEEGDPDAAFLLAALPGRTIPADVASRLQLRIVDGRITYPGSPDFKKRPKAKAKAKAKEVEADDDDGKVLRFGGDAQKDESEPEPTPEPTEPKAEPTEPKAADDSDRNDEPVPEWPGRTSPEAYLRLYPNGPKAPLARTVIAAAANAGADGAT